MRFHSALRQLATLSGGLALPFLLLPFLWETARATPPVAPDATQCAATNLLPRLKTDQPDRYRAFLEHARSIRNGKHIVWKIERKGLQPSWLFGTIHSRDPRVFTLPPNAFDAFDKVDVVLTELKELLQPEAITTTMWAHPEVTMLQDDTLDHLLPADETAELAASMKAHGLPLNLVAKMRPWYLLFHMQSSACEIRKANAGRPFLDQAIAQRAVQNKIDLVGLETPLEQFQAIAKVPDAEMLEALRQSFALPYTADDQFRTLVDLYLAHDTGKLFALNDIIVGDPATAALYAQYLLTDRNKVMAERAQPYLDKGRALIAVGADHLPGDGGLVELLRQQGFKVTAAD